MRPLPFAGLCFTGSVETDARGITFCAAPSDPEALPYLATLTIDPTPNEADAIAAQIWGWAEVCPELHYMAEQMTLPGMLV